MGKLAKCEGEVIVKSGTHSEIEFYEEDFILSNDIESEGHARIIVSALIADVLRKKIKNFKRVRTCQVIALEDSDQKSENGDLEDLLIEATKLQCVPENIDNYKRPDYKAKALQSAIDKHKERAKRKKPDSMKDLGPVED